MEQNIITDCTLKTSGGPVANNNYIFALTNVENKFYNNDKVKLFSGLSNCIEMNNSTLSATLNNGKVHTHA